ncbi:MAG: hypothetical protein V4537_11565 [Pseudomonadota bacterium]
MVRNDYSLPPRKALVCRIAGAIFLVLAMCTALSALSVAFAPGPKFDCAAGPCRWTIRPARLLDDDERAAVVASAATERRFDAYVGQPIVRVGLAGAMAIRSGPFAILLLGIGMALRRLGARAGDPLGDALPWLRVASLGALAQAFAGPIGASLMASLLSRGTPDGPHWILMLDFNAICIALMLGVAAYATVWALEAGIKAQRDLAEIV